MIIKIIRDSEKNEHSEKFNKKLENIKKNQKELKNTKLK